MSCHQTWGENRVYVRDDTGCLRAFPVGWTSLAPPDPFVVMARGRSWFRVVDLLEVARFVQGGRR